MDPAGFQCGPNERAQVETTAGLQVIVYVVMLAATHDDLPIGVFFHRKQAEMWVSGMTDDELVQLGRLTSEAFGYDAIEHFSHVSLCPLPVGPNQNGAIARFVIRDLD
jgi:hypothetical protein